MLSPSQKTNTECSAICALLSEYHDNLLSARQIIEVEKHLAVCLECLEASRGMEAMIHLLHSAPQRDTSDDFMMRLHDRLDVLEPAAMPALPLRARFREWAMSLILALRIYRLQAVSFSLVGVFLIGVFLLKQPPASHNTGEPEGQIEARSGLALPLEQNVVNSTEDPFSDPVANRLAVNALLSTGR